MEFDDKYFKARQEGVAWLNTSRRDYKTGVAVLAKLGYKPLLQCRLAMSQGNDVLKRILVQAVTDGCNFYRDPSKPKHADIVPAEVVNATDGRHTPVDEEQKAAATPTDSSMPGNVRTLCRWFARAYKQRDILHREMRGVGDSNDTQSMERRRLLSDRINALSDYMDAIYPIRKAYFDEGVVPSDDDMQRIGAPEALVPSPPAPSAPSSKPIAASLRLKDEDYDGMSVAELRTRKHSVRTLLVKKRNLLLYQSERRGDKENPMPDCPKRIKLEAQCRVFEDKLYEIEKALAKRG